MKSNKFKELKGIAHNLAYEFNISCEHIRYLITVSNTDRFYANILTGEIFLPEFDIPRNRNLVSSAESMINRRVLSVYDLNFTKIEIGVVMMNNNKTAISYSRIEEESGRCWGWHIKSNDPLIHP